MKEYPTLAEVLKRNGLDAEKIIVRDGEVSADLMHQFITLLRDAGWVARNDAQHTRIAEVWEILKPNIQISNNNVKGEREI